jgi:ribosomal protein L37AE/L43A
MKIQTIINQHRRDFQAIYVCEHCQAEAVGNGYDDAYFHNSVIPAMECEKCKQTSPSSYRPLATKYAEGQVV